MASSSTVEDATSSPRSPPLLGSHGPVDESATQVPRSPPQAPFTLDSVRDALVRQEDTIVFCLIERARYPYNPPAYDPSFPGSVLGGYGPTLARFYAMRAEEIDAKAGRYENPEEVPFFPDNLRMPLIPSYNHPQVLHPKSASVNVNKDIWEMYFNKLLPLFTVKGDDGNYGSTVASDLICLQAVSRRIHYGRFVAEVKFKDAPQEYTSLIRAQDRDGLMKLLTFEAVEESVKKRVAKKAMVFGQDVTLDDKGDNHHENDSVKYKVDPKVVARLYGEWVMPLTKLVQVEYLLRRLN